VEGYITLPQPSARNGVFRSHIIIIRIDNPSTCLPFSVFKACWHIANIYLSQSRAFVLRRSWRSSRTFCKWNAKPSHNSLLSRLTSLLYSNPGSKKDDEVMYGSGQSSDPVHSTNTGGVSGQGSHFGSSQRGTDPLSSSTNPTSSGVSSGYGSNTTGTGQQPNLSGNPTSRSNMPGGFDDGASTASIKSGVPGHPQSESGLIGSSGTGESLDTNKPLPHTPGSGLTGSNTTAGPHSSNLANRADPRIDPDLDGSRGLGRGTTGAGSTGTNLPDRSVGR